MLRRLWLPALVLLALVTWVAWVSWEDLLNYQTSKDKQLARATFENMSRLPQFEDNIVSFKYLGPGKYICETEGLDDAHSVGRFGYNAMVVLIERNGVVVTGRAAFTIHGYQDGVPIFESFYAFEGLPRVTLKGPYEGIDYTPTYSKAEPVRVEPVPVEPIPVDLVSPTVTVLS